MRSLLLSAALLAVPGAASAAPAETAGRPALLSPARELVLARHLAPEKPTVFLFFRSRSAMERSLAEQLSRELGAKAGLQWVQLNTGDEPLAKQYQVTETPVALVYDRRGRLVARSSDAAAIRSAAQKALGATRIDWAADDDPRMAEIEKLMGRRLQGGILRTMSLKPEWLAGINDVARKAHFADGYLDRRTKEMIASYVSALNKCKY